MTSNIYVTRSETELALGYQYQLYSKFILQWSKTLSRRKPACI